MIDESTCICATTHCKHYRGHLQNQVNGILYCKAFPNGIPDNIAVGKIVHNRIIEGQRWNLVYSKGTSSKIVKPYLVRNMINHKLHGTDALCTIFHDIYMQTDDDYIKLWARLGMRMSKNSHASLEDYKQMLLDLRIVEVKNDGREDWQLRPKSLYRKLKKER